MEGKDKMTELEHYADEQWMIKMYFLGTKHHVIVAALNSVLETSTKTFCQSFPSQTAI